MSISKQDFDALKHTLGEDWAKWVSEAAETQGKALEGASVQFKAMPKPPFGDDEDEDEEKKPEDKQISFTQKDIITLSAIKQLNDTATAQHAELDELRKQVKDLNNQIDQMKLGQGTQVDSMRRIEGYLGQLTGKQPASKAPQSQYFGGDANIDTAVQKNHEQQAQPKPVFEQMKASQNVVIPTMPNGDSSTQ